MTTDTRDSEAGNKPDESLLAEPATGRDPVTGRLLPGFSGNRLGRPRKGETVAERMARRDAKIAKRALDARDKRLMQTNMVGERAWTTYLAYNVGIPAQKYIIEQADSPLLALLTKHVDVIEGESRVLDQ